MRACFEYEMVHVLFLNSWSDVGFFFFNWQMRKEINECEVRVTSTIVTVLAATLPMFLRFPLCTFSDCSFCIFFLSLPAFCFWLCIPESSGLLTLLCVSPTKYLLSTTLFWKCFWILFFILFNDKLLSCQMDVVMISDNLDKLL